MMFPVNFRVCSVFFWLCGTSEMPGFWAGLGAGKSVERLKPHRPWPFEGLLEQKVWSQEVAAQQGNSPSLQMTKVAFTPAWEV